MKITRDDALIATVIGLIGALVVAAVDSGCQLAKTELRVEEAERDARRYHDLVARMCDERADLMAKIHELEWRLNTSKD